MKPYDFDKIVDRCGSDSIKWRTYPEDILPMWIADMDFRSADEIVQALHQRVDHGVFGYCGDSPELRIAIVERLERLYHWQITPEMIVFTPGVVTGFNMAARAFAQPGEGLLIQTPVYPPILDASQNARLKRQAAPLSYNPVNNCYSIDFDTFQQAITSQTRMFLLCNPHNPVGRVFRRNELIKMAEICLQQRMVICSDEIHCDLLYLGNQHIPIATLDPEIANQTVTLMAPSKTYNIAGLDCAYAVIPNPDLRRIYDGSRAGLVGWVNVLGMAAAIAAYRYGQDWLTQVLAYLEANRRLLANFVATNLPGIRLTIPEATYLAWLDCREAGLAGFPAKFFEEHARIGLNEGAAFGPGGEGYVRLNFASPRSTLIEGLQRMQAALAQEK